MFLSSSASIPSFKARGLSVTQQVLSRPEPQSKHIQDYLKQSDERITRQTAQLGLAQINEVPGGSTSVLGKEKKEKSALDTPQRTKNKLDKEK